MTSAASGCTSGVFPCARARSQIFLIVFEWMSDMGKTDGSDFKSVVLPSRTFVGFATFIAFILSLFLASVISFFESDKTSELRITLYFIFIMYTMLLSIHALLVRNFNRELSINAIKDINYLSIMFAISLIIFFHSNERIQYLFNFAKIILSALVIFCIKNNDGRQAIFGIALSGTSILSLFFEENVI